LNNLSVHQSIVSTFTKTMPKQLHIFIFIFRDCNVEFFGCVVCH
jgi:hypothetical protein